MVAATPVGQLFLGLQPSLGLCPRLQLVSILSGLWSLGWIELACEPVSSSAWGLLSHRVSSYRDPCFPLPAERETLKDYMGRGWGGTQIPTSARSGPSVKCQCQKHSGSPLTNPDILDQSLFYPLPQFPHMENGHPQ